MHDLIITLVFLYIGWCNPQKLSKVSNFKEVAGQNG